MDGKDLGRLVTRIAKSARVVIVSNREPWPTLRRW